MVSAYGHCLCGPALGLSWLPTDQQMRHMDKSLAFLGLFPRLSNEGFA